MKPRLLWDELQKYGYIFSWKRSLLVYGLWVFATILLGLFFHLQGAYLWILCGWTILLLPLFLRNLYKNRYIQQQFLEANTYIEQFLYSFQKSGKILTTLEDVSRLFPRGQMKDTVESAIYYIKHTYGENQVSQQGLAIVEKSYPLAQIATMHRFAIQVEKNGGEYGESILLMLDARRLWADRMYEFLKEKRRKRMQILISVIASLLLCSSLVVISKQISVDISQYRISSISTLLVLMIDFLIFYKADQRLSIGLIADETMPKDLMRQLEKVERVHITGKKELGYSIAKKNVSRGIQIAFPQWLMEVSLLLQSENVQVAIMKSYEDAPELLKNELANMIESLRLHPTDMEPYLSFLQEYHLPEVQSAMKMLYSISEGTGGNAASQIADIIRRNQLLLGQAEKLKQEDALAGMYALFLAPQLTGAAKLLIDMLVIFYGLSQMGILRA